MGASGGASEGLVARGVFPGAADAGAARAVGTGGSGVERMSLRPRPESQTAAEVGLEREDEADLVALELADDGVEGR